MFKSFIGMFLLLLLLASPLSAEENPAGFIKNLQGTVSVQRQGSSILAQKGMKIYVQDHIITGADGSVGLILQDNTIFSLGPDSQQALEEFTFSPDQGRFGLLVNMIELANVPVFLLWNRSVSSLLSTFRNHHREHPCRHDRPPCSG